MDITYTYEPKNNGRDFNGVLIVLREPRVKPPISDPEEISRLHKKWFLDMLEEKGGSRYRNYLERLLTYTGIPNPDSCNLQEIAYGNIYRGGKDSGSGVGESYRKTLSDFEQEHFENIIKHFEGKVKYIFTCGDIYAKWKEVLDIKTDEPNGVQYPEAKLSEQRQKRCFHYTEITVYEISHPAYRGAYPCEATENCCI